MGWRATWIDAGLGCLAPDPCCACDRTAGTAAGWCDDCFASLPWQGSDRCGFCLLPLAGGVCASCRREPWDTARVAVEYGTPVPAMVGRWKFRPDAVLSRSLAAVVEEGIARDPALGRIDLVTCVPQPAAAWVGAGSHRPSISPGWWHGLPAPPWAIRCAGPAERRPRWD